MMLGSGRVRERMIAKWNELSVEGARPSRLITDVSNGSERCGVVQPWTMVRATFHLNPLPSGFDRHGRRSGSRIGCIPGTLDVPCRILRPAASRECATPSISQPTESLAGQTDREQGSWRTLLSVAPRLTPPGAGRIVRGYSRDARLRGEPGGRHFVLPHNRKRVGHA